VIQKIFDLNGRPLEGQSHGLKDKTVTHIFRMEGDRIVRFDIGGCKLGREWWQPRQVAGLLVP
jgi:hypothetical protein